MKEKVSNLKIVTPKTVFRSPSRNPRKVNINYIPEYTLIFLPLPHLSPFFLCRQLKETGTRAGTSFQNGAP